MSNLTDKLRTLARRRGTESETAQFGRDARRDWQAVFITFLVLNLAALAFNLFVYTQIDQGEIFLVDKREPVTLRTLNRFDLEKTVAFFEEKQRRFDALKNRPFSIPDPGPAITPKQ